MRESAKQGELRWKKLSMLQKAYPSFNPFLDRCMEYLGFDTTWMQHDIASFIDYGGQFIMVQAQRGEAKTTIAACKAVHALIHNPKARVLVVSAGGKTASEIATLIQRIIMTMPELECLRPDGNNGDRTSVEAFDVHYSLKGIDKSPSVACIGVTGNLPGKRADLLIADDIESPKNSMTSAMREQLITLSLEFGAICSTGRIIYLGTPQTGESIYNTLPGRGFTVRIWPGRYPTPAEMHNYGEYLAPSIRERLNADPSLAFGGGALGDRGKPTDPQLLDEEAHQAKLRDRGESSYQLNYMLNTKLMDAQRFPLKLKDIVVMRGGGELYPLTVTRGYGHGAVKDYSSSGMGFQLSLAHAVSEQVAPLQGKHFRIDPAGGGKNGDETGWACTGFLNGNIFVLGVGGVPGGYDLEVMEELANKVVSFMPNTVSIEKNMGHGGFAAVFLPILRRVGKAVGWNGSVTEDFVSGQKEVRIAGTLEPVMGRGSLIFMESIVEDDDTSTAKYPGQRLMYSVFHQIAKLTRARGSLAHDDRLDALEGAVRPWVQYLAIDQQDKIEADEKAKYAAFMADPFNRKRVMAQAPNNRGGIMARFKR